MQSLSSDTVCWLILKLRELGAKEGVVEPDPGSNPTDDQERSVLEDYADDPVVEELSSLIMDLNDDQQVELIALAWLGRGDFERSEWREALSEARNEHRQHRDNTAHYLLGTPLIADFLEEGLAAFEISCAEFDSEYL
jgi:hypothetical protein